MKNNNEALVGFYAAYVLNENKKRVDEAEIHQHREGVFEIGKDCKEVKYKGY
jgi:hypothetical protein